MRIIGSLNILNGKVDYFIRNKISLATIYCFYQELVNTYANKQIYTILDNGPIHYHPDILAALPLSIYASWLNVIEKLWRKLKQELLHMRPI